MAHIHKRYFSGAGWLYRGLGQSATLITEDEGRYTRFLGKMATRYSYSFDLQ